MKKTLLFLALAVLFVGCKDDGDGRMDPNAKISLRAAKNTTTNATRNPEHLSPLEIVKQATQIIFINKEKFPFSDQLSRGFSDGQKDLVNVRLLMWGTDIINQEGEWSDNFIGGSDIVLVRDIDVANPYPRVTLDTIGYIKNATVRAAKKTTKAAYDRGDYAEVYKIFDTAFTFDPITGPEWRALKAKGEN